MVGKPISLKDAADYREAKDRAALVVNAIANLRLHLMVMHDTESYRALGFDKWQHWLIALGIDGDMPDDVDWEGLDELWPLSLYDTLESIRIWWWEGPTIWERRRPADDDR